MVVFFSNDLNRLFANSTEKLTLSAYKINVNSSIVIINIPFKCMFMFFKDFFNSIIDLFNVFSCKVVKFCKGG